MTHDADSGRDQQIPTTDVTEAYASEAMTGQQDTRDTVAVQGVVERIVFVAADGATVASLALDETDRTVMIAGPALLGVRPGETVRVRGRWAASARHGDTLRVHSCEHVLPASVHAIRCYLGSGLIKGIGPTIAQAIVARFGADTLTVIDQTPERLLEVVLIGRVRLDKIKTGWVDHQAIRETMIFLQGVGVSPGLAARIHTELGAEALRVVQHQPYQLIDRVRGIGFVIADTIALAVGIPEHSTERLQAAVMHVLDDTRAKIGHCFLHYQTLITQAGGLVGQDEQPLRDALHRLRDQGRVVIEQAPDQSDDVVVFPVWLHRAETALAEHLLRLRRARSGLPRAVQSLAESAAATATLATQGGASRLDLSTLDECQRQAVRMALTETVSVLTGGPGCGKSFTVGVIAAVVRAGGATVALTAPTGRAAKRLSELTGLPAHTVHRLVHGRRDVAEEGILFDVGDALNADLIVVDEASMVDVTIAAKLLAEIPAGTHVLFVGDVNQLPSVGPGCVLSDLLRAGHIPRTRLQTIHRQGPGSRIAHAAAQILAGRRFDNNPEVWFLSVPETSQDTIGELVVDIATHRIPTKHGIDPRDVQVLCPGKTTDTGARALSRTIQDTLNPHRDDQPHYWADERPFRVGDKVMPIRNDYRKGDHGVFNGSVGTITAINLDDRHVHVLLDDTETVTYDFDELDELAHAYAITVHRSQGSEYPYVVVPLAANVPNILLQRNLLYTAITRAKKAVVIVGHDRALATALQRAPRRRNTCLTARLQEGTPDPGNEQLTAF